MYELILPVFKELERKNVPYCLTRDADRLDELFGSIEIDLLVQSDRFAELHDLLARSGFLEVSSFGYAPHHFFVAYDRDSGGWLKLDVVTEVAYGKPVQALRTSLAEACLQNRRRRGPTFALAPEDELVTLLLHCVLDKERFAPIRSQRIRALCHQITNESYLSKSLLNYWSPTMSWPRLSALIDAENWDALLAERATVASHLARLDRIGTVGRRLAYRLLRKLNRWAGLRRPHALTVALLAPDGAGKSTLAKGVQASFYFPVRSVYMGLYQKGARAERWRIPGLGFVSQLSMQWGRYLIARYHRACGRLVIFDRYTFDAMLPPRKPLGWLGRLRRWLLAHACPAPDLVFVLDAPGEMLYARKGEHNVAILEQQRQSYLALRPHFPEMVVVDATRDTEHVRREVMAAIWRGYMTQTSKT